MKTFFLIRTRFIVLLVFVALATSSYSAEKRLIPTDYKSCGPDKSSPWSAQRLWDGIEDKDHKWCCFHAGYVVPQTHWVIMDLGAVFPISQLVVVHDGDTENLRHLRTEDMKFFGGTRSMDGPWKLLKEIKNNNKNRNEIKLDNVKVRYLGMEVSDPQYGEGPDGKQDDWAVRIRELYIFTPESQPPSSSSAFSVNEPSPFDASRKTSKANPFHLPNPPGRQYTGRSRTNPPSPSPSSVSTAQIGPASSGSPASSPDAFNLSSTTQHESKPPTREPMKNTIYFFYKPGVSRCQKMEQLFSSPRVTQAMQGCGFKKISVAGQETHWTRQGIFIVPTLIKTDPQGTVLKKSTSIFSEQDLLGFLE